MPDEIGNKAILAVEYVPATHEIQLTVPQDFILALGLLEYVREAVMMRQVRPGLMPQVMRVPAGVMPKPS